MLFNLFKKLFGKKQPPAGSDAIPSDYDQEWYEERILALRIQLHHILSNKYKCTGLSYQDMVYGNIEQIIDDAKFKLFTAVDPTTFEMVYEFQGKYFRLIKDRKDRKSLLAEKGRIEKIIEKIKSLRTELIKHGWKPPVSPDVFLSGSGMWTVVGSPITSSGTISPGVSVTVGGGGIAGSWPASVPIGVPIAVGGGASGATSIGGSFAFPAKPIFPPMGTLWGSSFPMTPATGDIFYRDDLNKTYFFDGANWLELI